MKVQCHNRFFKDIRRPDGTSALLLQTTTCYPFGMLSDKADNGTDNKYLYNGKELQDESLGGVSLDWYGARFYDPSNS